MGEAFASIKYYRFQPNDTKNFRIFVYNVAHIKRLLFDLFYRLLTYGFACKKFNLFNLIGEIYKMACLNEL